MSGKKLPQPDSVSRSSLYDLYLTCLTLLRAGKIPPISLAGCVQMRMASFYKPPTSVSLALQLRVKFPPVDVTSWQQEIQGFTRVYRMVDKRY